MWFLRRLSPEQVKCTGLDNNSLYLFKNDTTDYKQLKTNMTEILLGWPLEVNKSSSRHFARSSKTNKFPDISKAEIYRKDGHLVTFAPTGSGKGVSVIIPNLLHYKGPVITVDPKGENFAVTARYRQETLGQRIILLDPFEAVDNKLINDVGVERASLNPLNLGESFGVHTEIQIPMLAAIFSGESTDVGGDQRFWDQEAQKLLSGVLGATIHKAKVENKEPSFQSFIDLLFQDDVVYNLAVILDTQKDLYEFSYKAIAAFLQKADKERSGVLSTVHSYLTPFISRKLNTYLNTSTLTPQDISSNDNYTVYVVIPPSKLVSHAILLRLWIATMLNTIMERDEKPLMRTLFLLDECAQLGRLDELTKAITLLRGYGLQVWMFFQDFSQITALYPANYPTMINNCGVFQSFGVTRNSAAESIAETIGKYEPHQLTQLDKTQQIISISNTSPEIYRLMNYLEDFPFQGLYELNPLFSKQNNSKGNFNLGFPCNFVKSHI